MKYILTVIGVLLNLSSAHATTLSCSSDPSPGTRDRNAGIVIADYLAGNCVNEEDGSQFFVSMAGGGIALKNGSYTSFDVSCDNYVGQNIVGEYAGGKISVAVFLGLTAAVYHNPVKEVLCYVEGIGYEMGASIALGTLSIEPLKDVEKTDK